VPRGVARRRAYVRSVAIGLVLILCLAVVATAVRAAPYSISIAATGSNGVGRITTPGRPCAEGGDGASWHYDYGSPLAPGKFSGLPGELRFHLDLHSEDGSTRVDPRAPRVSPAFLQGEESHASLVNRRGTVKLRLSAGDCAKPPLQFDGTTTSGSGTWRVGSSSGAYRNATGNGTFTLTADVAPGADNPFDLQLAGSIDVLLPSLKVDVVQTYWGFLGADYLIRKVTVVYRITNTGPGDAFGVRLVSSSSSTPGVTALGPVPQNLGDLLGDPDGAGPASGDSEIIRVRYQLGLLQPCNLVLLGCTFDTTLGVEMPDALDRPATYTHTNTGVRAPDFPPPL
jgi:hypothetical protein